MSELTKLAEIAAKHLSNAFLSMASDFAKLHSAAPLSQTEEKSNWVSLESVGYTKRDVYKIGDPIMVMLDGGMLPTKMRVSHVMEVGVYLAYCQRQPKSSGRAISHDQILGLDPDR
jgi:hypothetical protein